MNIHTVQAAQALAVDQQREFAVNFIDRRSGDMRLSIRVRQTPLQLTPNTGVERQNQAEVARHLSGSEMRTLIPEGLL
jgi:hypothetical protein